MSKRGRGRGRKRFREEYVEPAEPKKKANKRTVFSESGSLESTASPESIKIKKTKNFLQQKLIERTSIFWNRLALRGPHVPSVPIAIHKNRPLFNVFRLICHRIHENCIEYLKNDLPEYEKRGVLPEKSNVKEILNEMCKKVLKIEDNGGVYKFYKKNMMDPILELFEKSDVDVSLDIYPELCERLGGFCEKFNVKATERELEQIWYSLVPHFFSMAFELIPFLLIIELKNGQLQIEEFRPFRVHSIKLYQQPISDHLPPSVLSPLSQLNKTLFYRDASNTLWTVISCEESDHLLEHVLEFGLIQVLPESVKKFLTGWIIGVRKTMRNKLCKGTQQQAANMFLGKILPLKLKATDRKFQLLISNIVEPTLNQEPFRVFDGNWQNYVMEMIKQKSNEFAKSHENFFKIACKLIPKSKSRLAAHFSDSPSDQAMLFHTCAQLLRFVVIFTCQTIRLVFRYEGLDKFTYDGTMDNYAHGFVKNREYEQKPTIRLPTPLETPTIDDQVVAGAVQVPASERKSFVVKPELPSTVPIPASGSFDYPREKKFRPEQARKSSTESPEPVPEKKFTPNPAKKSFAVEPSSAVKRESDLSAEVTDEELNAARALRPASEASNGDRRIEEDDRIPEEWKEMYRMLCQWNTELKEQRERTEKQFNYFCK